MSDINQLMARVSIPSSTTAAANTDSVVTVTAPSSATNTIYITGLLLSASGALGAAVGVTLAGVLGPAGTAVTITFQLPASAIAPVALQFGGHPLKILPGTNAVLTLPALGTAIVGSATLFYYIGTV